jgi:hypothetical protein
MAVAVTAFTKLRLDNASDMRESPRNRLEMTGPEQPNDHQAAAETLSRKLN